MIVTLTSAGLSPAEVTKHLEEERFEHRAPLAGEIPLSSHGGLTGYLLLSTGTVPATGSPARSLLGVSLFTCTAPSCEEAREAAADFPGAARRITLPEGASVTDVRYGDANEDGRTDILVLLSTGGGILFEQSPGERVGPPPARPAAPRPAPRPSGR